MDGSILVAAADIIPELGTVVGATGTEGILFIDSADGNKFKVRMPNNTIMAVKVGAEYVTAVVIP